MIDIIELGSNNPILQDHLVLGEKVFPGLAMVDLLFQWFVESGHSIEKLNLNDVTIYRPLVVADGKSAVLKLIAEEQSKGHWSLQVLEKDDKQNEILYVKAQMRLHNQGWENRQKTLDFSLGARLESLDTIYARCRELDLIHRGHIKPEGNIEVTATGRLIKLKLSEEAMIDAEQYLFHPALLDGAGIAADIVFGFDEHDKQLYLPLYYHSFTAKRQLPNTCWVEVAKSSRITRGELLSVTLDFYDLSGEFIAQLKNLTVKPLRKEAQGEFQLEGTAVNAELRGRATIDIPDDAGSIEAIKALVAAQLDIDIESVSTTSGYYEMGFSSRKLLELTQKLASLFGSNGDDLELSPTLLFEYKTIEELSSYFAELKISVQQAAVSTSQSRPMPVVASTEKVAIIGIAGRYPEADTIEEFWQNLCEGRNSVTEIPEQRWSSREVEQETGSTAFSNWGGFVNNVDCFDAAFFNVSPREAKLIDPQERLFLQVSWQAIEDAGYTPETLAGQSRNVGVFAGVMHNDYTLIGAASFSKERQFPLSLNSAGVANRVSYACDFHGPSMSIDTLCSSSLTAVHLAVESIKRGESEVAICGGVNLSLHPNKYVSYGLMGMHSKHGQCNSFGIDADGYVSSEGVGAIVLKPLHKAEQDGDQIYGVVLASSLNHGGRASGITVPNPVAQAAVIGKCIQNADVDARDISYIEAHGTGTLLGDPIELQGLSKAFGEYTQDLGYCALGSVKSNIGHAESAAGIGGLTKLLLQMKYQMLVPSLHSERINPHLDLSCTPFYLQHKLEPWQSYKDAAGISKPLVGAISSFGAYGANAHIIVGQHISEREAAIFDGPFAIPLSAHTPEQLSQYCKNLRTHITEHYGELFKCNVEKANKHQQLKSAVQQKVVAFLLQMLALRIDAICFKRPLSQFGIGRLQRLTLLNELENELHIRIDPKAFVESVSLGDIIDCLVEQICAHGSKSTIEALLGCEYSTEVSTFDKKATNLLGNIAYTMQVGRIQLPQRTVFITDCLSDLVEQLSAFSSTQPVQSTASLPKPAQYLVEQFLQGVQVNWSSLYGHHKHQRLSLPQYPFRLERHWIENANVQVIPQIAISSETEPATDSGHKMVYFTSDWLPTETTTVIKDRKTTVFTLQDYETAISAALGSGDINTELVTIQSSDSGAEQLQAMVASLFEHYHSKQAQASNSLHHWVVYLPYNGSTYPFGGLMGALRTISMESTFITTQLLFDAALQSNEPVLITEHLRQELILGSSGREVVYTADNQILSLQQKALTVPEKVGLTVKTDDVKVYLITGGLGKLGLLFAEYLGKGTANRFILTGRSAPGDRSREELDKLHKAGIDVSYHRLDIMDRETVNDFISTIMIHYGVINGVIHSAGAKNDNFIGNKSWQDIAEVLAPKLIATDNIDYCTRHVELDFFITFSSLAYLGSSGQFDYATGNAYQNDFAANRAALVKKGERHGLSLSLNWPLWQEGGMTPGEYFEKQMFNVMGMIAMQSSDGLTAYDFAVEQKLNQLAVVYGDPDKIAKHFKIRGLDESQSQPAEIGESKYKENTTSNARMKLMEIVVHSVKEILEVTDMSGCYDVKLQELGADSIMLTELAHALNSALGYELTAASFYELDCVTEIVGYLEANLPQSVETGIEEVIHTTVLAAEAMSEPKKQIEAETLQIPLSHLNDSRKDKLAVIGYSGHFPGSNTLSEFWQSIVEGETQTGLVPPEQWVDRGVKVTPEQTPSMKWAALLDNIKGFNPQLWGIRQELAVQIDPQQRLLMQSLWQCVEQSGYSVASLAKKRVGLFLAVDSTDYKSVLADAGQKLNLTAGLSAGMLANSISYYFDLRGPSEVVDTACSSVYVALNRAQSAVQNGECDEAIVAGVKLLLDSKEFELREGANLLSKNGEVRSFDKCAQGYVRGEGLGCIYLKPLQAAQSANDEVHGIVAGLAVGHNGHDAISNTAPSVAQQSKVIARAYESADIASDSVHYLEAHGTATEYGDVAEIAAFKKFLSDSMSKEQYRAHNCVISTIKPNIGHLEGASGIASIIKVLLAFKHQVIPPVANFETLHPAIFLQGVPLSVLAQAQDWQQLSQVSIDKGLPQRASLHSVGIGGVNAHVIFEAPQPSDIPVAKATQIYDTEQHYVLTISADCEQSIDLYRKDWLEFFSNQGGNETLSDIAFSSRICRNCMSHRLVYIAKDKQQFIQLLGESSVPTQITETSHGYLGYAVVINNEEQKNTIGGQSLAFATVSDKLKLALLWLAGKDNAFEKLNEVPANRVYIPCLPFVNKPYWPQVTAENELEGQDLEHENNFLFDILLGEP